MFGFFNINKPAGHTSRDIVNQLQRALKCKLGHAGTLDPLATGVLVVAAGKATRLISYLHAWAKCYRATFFLGRHSDTEDIDGVVEMENSPYAPSETQIRAAASQLVGEIEQVPPQYSALKVAGKRAYDLARRGKVVELAARKVIVHQLEVVAYDYPKLVLNIHCGSGTYVRSLGRDLAIACGTQAVMSVLIRTSVGPFGLADSVAANDITRESAEQFLLSPLMALDHLPQVQLDAQCIAKLQQGQFVPNPGEPAPELLAVDSNGSLVAIVRSRDGNLLQPVRNFG